MHLEAITAEAPVDPDAAAVASLVRRARAGETAAYERLYRLQAPRIYGLCVRLCGDRDRAKELAQDAFVQAWKKLSLLDVDAAFPAWLYRIAVNVGITALRQRSRRWARETGSEMLEALEPSRAARSENVGLRLDLERAIAKLPERARTVLVLHDIEGYGHAEIAAQMQIAAGTAKAHLHRARQLLQEALRS